MQSADEALVRGVDDLRSNVRGDRVGRVVDNTHRPADRVACRGDERGGLEDGDHALGVHCGAAQRLRHLLDVACDHPEHELLHEAARDCLLDAAAAPSPPCRSLLRMHFFQSPRERHAGGATVRAVLSASANSRRMA